MNPMSLTTLATNASACLPDFWLSVRFGIATRLPRVATRGHTRTSVKRMGHPARWIRLGRHSRSHRGPSVRTVGPPSTRELGQPAGDAIRAGSAAEEGEYGSAVRRVQP